MLINTQDLGPTPDGSEVPTRMHYEIRSAENATICEISPHGRVSRNGVDATDDDSALAACFCEWMKVMYGIEIKRGEPCSKE